MASTKKVAPKAVKPIESQQNNELPTNKDKNSTAEADPPKITKLGPAKTPSKYKQDGSANKTDGAAKPAPKVEKKEDRASNDDLNKKKQIKAQSMVQQSNSDQDTGDNEEVETSSEVVADDFDSDSHSVHSLAQRSRLADNIMDDADKYDFADNYQQTEDDVNPSRLDDKQYLQQGDKYIKEKEADDIWEEEEKDDSNADEYD